jgi:hypothetical protein
MYATERSRVRRWRRGLIHLAPIIRVYTNVLLNLST